MQQQKTHRTHLQNKKIQIYPSIANLHSNCRHLLTHPPKGYYFVGLENSRKLSFIKFIRSFKIVRTLYHLFLKIFRTTKLVDIAYDSKIMPGIDFIFAVDKMYAGNIPWVLYLSDCTPYNLAGYNYKLFLENVPKIEKILSSPKCRKIICISRPAIKLIKKHFSKCVYNKTMHIDLPRLEPQTNQKPRKNPKLTFLFVGSINNPQDFYLKGGMETLTVFEQIQKKYLCQIILKCQIPKKLRKRVFGNKDIRVIENMISQKEIEKLYLSSDILLSPAHTNMGVNFEAMQFGLPIIVLDTFFIDEYIKNNYNGIVVKKSNKIRAYRYEGYPTNLRAETFIKEVENVDKEVIKRLFKAAEYLIKNPSERKRIGKNGKRFTKKVFSIDKFNKKLKKILDEAIKN